MAPLLCLAFQMAVILSQPVLSIAFSIPRPIHTSSGARNDIQLATKWKSVGPRLWNTPSRDAADTTDHRPATEMSVGKSFASDEFDINGNALSSQKSSSSPPFPIVLWRFTRPHTLIGSAIAIPSIFLLAAPTYASFCTSRTLASLLYAVVPSLLMNIYITGLNQITDVEIDKINKPELPMAKGDLKYSTATAVVLACLAISLAMSVAHPVFSTMGLQVALWGSFLLGTLYSLPPFRMKRHPFLAAFCIVAVRGTIINAGFYSHALSSAFGSGASAISSAGVLNCLLNDWKCGLSSLFFGVFGIVIALMKDVPDADGDRKFNIRSFTVRLGQKRVFSTMKGLLAGLFAVYGAGLMRWSTMTPMMPVAVTRGLVGLCCWAAGWTVNRVSRGVNAEDSGEVYNYYMYLWKLFYLSYLALPFVK
mmetsp:Transcript_4177/g.8012  ORF Transcript_4177/g.8012 Transcript_4177/m.8012 type:complete len:421 (+) Transcript_4177:132-1394(+)